MKRRFRRLRTRVGRRRSNTSGRALGLGALIVGLPVLTWQLLTLAALTVVTTAHAATGNCLDVEPCERWSPVAVDALSCLILLLSGMFGVAVVAGQARDRAWARRPGVLLAAVLVVWASTAGELLYLALSGRISS